MIIVFTGKLGTGKTIGAVNLTKRCYNSGYTLYSNIKLTKMPYIPLSKVEDFNSIETKKNLFLLDEFWLNSDSRKSNSILNMLGTTHILQSRKKHIDTIITSQDFYQLDKRIRFVTNWIIEPKILSTRNGKPHLMLMTIHDLDNEKISRMVIDISGDLEEYDTDELVEVLGDNREEFLDEILVLYKDWYGLGLSRKGLIAKLKKIDNLTPSEASTVADYLGSLSEYEVYDKYIEDMKNEKKNG